MNTASPWTGTLRHVLAQPTNGIVGLVDELLAVCGEHGLQLDWQSDRWRVRSSSEDWHELPDVPLRKTVFRAILARLAVLCNERRQGSASPYGGQGEIAVGTDPVTVFRVEFVNTPGEQRLELTQDQPGKRKPAGGHPMLAALLAEVPRIRTNLSGWATGHLVPALAAFHDEATEAQLATALGDLRQVLRDRADVDLWLGDIARLGTGEYVGELHSMTSPSKYRDRQELTTPPTANRTSIELARQVREALTRTPDKPEPRATPSSRSRPGAK
jgi:hypothetical protein